jgi:hypothetical protein
VGRLLSKRCPCAWTVGGRGLSRHVVDATFSATAGIGVRTAGAALGGTVCAPAWRGKSCRYLVATNDRAIQPALQRSMAKLNAAVVEIAANHVAMLSHPQEVASLIAG